MDPKKRKRYLGQQAIEDYIQKTKKPKFHFFVLVNKENLVEWSLKTHPHLDKNKLCKLWQTRFALSLKMSNKDVYPDAYVCVCVCVLMSELMQLLALFLIEPSRRKECIHGK
ncbi:hypothetical protein DM01DRAFT_304229 [Hesseltinella vesiculosa]|uniref:Uncharacterized protein n=1 Tax=Hesseltinella vesiculosa TaxID=101127 RepID=A0A1X2G665_9FUNG|nr:hypothetical protein DM01DRAFT_304229 [Hesseltinella vesiculosa]